MTPDATKPSKPQLEESDLFTPRFDNQGLVTCVTIDEGTRELLMVAHMNAEALRLTLESGIVHYWSRSRRSIWRKGDTSGQTQTLVEMRVDCDQDALELIVRVAGDGGACHTGRRSCFYRRVEAKDGDPRLAFVSRREA